MHSFFWVRLYVSWSEFRPEPGRQAKVIHTKRKILGISSFAELFGGLEDPDDLDSPKSLIRIRIQALWIRVGSTYIREKKRQIFKSKTAYIDGQTSVRYLSML
jgi:hypothetical protein